MFACQSHDDILKAYERARDVYKRFGVNTDETLAAMESVHISLHCWQGDDFVGFEGQDELSGGGILATGNYPGRARTGDELRQDYDKAFSLIPGTHRANLHSIYAEPSSGKPDRDELTAEHFSKWIAWARRRGIGLDFNPTFFSHPRAASGYTIAGKDARTRDFWIRHGKACRRIAAEIGKQQGGECVNNLWIPDGSKDLPADRLTHRQILKESLDEIYAEKLDRKYIADSVESKLFGIGSESFVVGSHEFYLGYALRNDIMICFDLGHFHPTEEVGDKLSAVLVYLDKLLLHVSRGVRWDSDHVVILSDELLGIAREIKRCGALDTVRVALDFFDAGINRVTAWVTGTRAALKALLIAMLEPTELLRAEEERGNLGNRLALMEEIKALPWGSVWDKFCVDHSTPAGASWLNDIAAYEEQVQGKRT